MASIIGYGFHPANPAPIIFTCATKSFPRSTAPEDSYPFQAEFFADRYFAGRILRNQSILSKMEVPRVAIAMGHYTAGAAYVSALSEFNIMVEDTGAIFLGGPPVVKAATGEDVSAQQLGGRPHAYERVGHERLFRKLRDARHCDRT
ncbi:carboxyl transferase domain-containing protein [Bradyrhizobium sp. 164]|uniref:carboxyl transferase domain-containing protein n=1 Tax=Bradyrhizobium sp. 164 TaxID=2782637 RepID=UPI002097AE45|nr:carboxyl transferase domain-containing protein [Bradyrhizobium sp. 164]